MPHSAQISNIIPMPNLSAPPQRARASRFWAAQAGQETAIRRLEVLESLIQRHNDPVLHPEWLDEYIDLGLELAEYAGRRNLLPLQESWLKRIYNTLRDTAFNLDCHENWRQQCLDFLYQPFFALQHFYRVQPNGRQRIRTLFRDLTMITRYVV